MSIKYSLTFCLFQGVDFGYSSKEVLFKNLDFGIDMDSRSKS